MESDEQLGCICEAIGDGKVEQNVTLCLVTEAHVARHAHDGVEQETEGHHRYDDPHHDHIRSAVLTRRKAIVCGNSARVLTLAHASILATTRTNMALVHPTVGTIVPASPARPCSETGSDLGEHGSLGRCSKGHLTQGLRA